MAMTYSVYITGIKGGVTGDEAARKLAALFKLPQQRAASILASGKFPVKGGLDLKTSAKYEEALEACGVTCVVEPDGARAEQVKQVASEQASPEQTENPARPGTQEKLQEKESGQDGAKLPPDESRMSSFTWGLVSALSIAIIAAVLMKNFGIFDSAEEPFKASKLDSAAQVGKSTPADIEIFKSVGGVENKDESMWRGYRATSFRAVYDEQTKLLSAITVGLWSGKGEGHKMAGLDNLKKTLAADCGEIWTRSDITMESTNIQVASKYPVTCSIDVRNQSGEQPVDGVLVTLMIDPETLKSAGATGVKNGSPDPVEQKISGCVDGKVAQLRHDFGGENEDVPALVLEEFEAECRKDGGV